MGKKGKKTKKAVKGRGNGSCVGFSMEMGRERENWLIKWESKDENVGKGDVYIRDVSALDRDGVDPTKHRLLFNYGFILDHVSNFQPLNPFTKMP